MAQTRKKPRDGLDAWDSGELGREAAFAQRVTLSDETSLDEAVGLQMISIRLQKSLIDDLKFIATAHGIGYQPLVRDVLSRFVVHEKNQIIADAINRKKLEQQQEKMMSSSASKSKADKRAA